MKKKEHTEHAVKHTKPSKKFNIRVKPYQALAVILGILLIVSILTGGFGLEKGKISREKAAQNAVAYINSNLLEGDATAKVIETKTEGDLYLIKIDIMGYEYDTYVTKDGKLLFPSAFELEPKSIVTGSAVADHSITKSDRPDAKVFVMSYCPYGLQAMKAVIPAREVLKDVADITINFVDYAMQGKPELDENLRMYCLQEEQNDKFWDYIECFVQTDNYKSCLVEAKVDVSKMEACVERTDKAAKVTELYNDKSTWLSGMFPQFNVEQDLNEMYGVQGSPTTVINGKVVSVARSAQGYLDSICAGFEKQPSACDAKLSSASAAPGFGSLDAAGTASAAAAQCG